MRAQGLWDAVQAWTVLQTLSEEEDREASARGKAGALPDGQHQNQGHPQQDQDQEMCSHARGAAAARANAVTVLHVCGMFHIAHYGGQ